MPNNFEYIISLQDKFSATAEKANEVMGKIGESTKKTNELLDKIEGTSSSTFGKFSNSAQSAVKKSGQLTKSIEDLKKKLEIAQSGMQKTHSRNAFKFYQEEAKKLEAQIAKLERGILSSGIGGKIKEWRQDFADSLPGANFIKNPLTIASATIGGLWQATLKAMDAGKEKMKMQVLTGSQEIGSALYDGLTKFATDTVFGSEVYDMGAQMLANGIASADVLPLMKQLGDISMGDADKLGSLSLAFSQINSAGKLTGQDLNQMINAGFNPLQVISEKTGESMVSLREKMGKGLITITDVRNAMNLATGEGGDFYGMLEKVASTPYGQLEGLRGQLDQMWKSIGETFLPIATKLMKIISWIGEKAGPYLKPFAAVLGAVSAALLVLAAAQWVANLAVWAFPGTWIIAAIVALIAAIAWLVTSVTGWGKAWDHTVKAAKLIWEAFVAKNKADFDFLVNSIMNGIDKIRIGWLEFKQFFGAENQDLIDQINNDVERRKQEIHTGYAEAGKLGLQAVDELKNAWNSLEVKDSPVSNFGIDMPTGIPGIMAGKGSEDKGSKSKDAKKTNTAIATGGTKHNYITINLRELIGIQNYNGSKDSVANKAGEEIMDSLLRIVASATTAAG